MGTDHKIMIQFPSQGAPEPNPSAQARCEAQASLGSSQMVASPEVTWACNFQALAGIANDVLTLPGSVVGTLGACSCHFQVMTGALKAVLILHGNWETWSWTGTSLRVLWGEAKLTSQGLQTQVSEVQPGLWLVFRSMPTPSQQYPKILHFTSF